MTKENLKILYALEVLDYYDRNYLSQPLLSPNKLSLEKQRLLKQCLEEYD